MAICNRKDILDLRTDLSVLKEMPGQLEETKVPVSPMAELAGVYRHIGAGGTVMRPTRVNGPAMIFHKIQGFEDARIVIGLLGSRERVAALLGCEKDRLGQLLCECVNNPIQPIVTQEPAPSREVVHLASEDGFDLHKLVPAPTNTPLDAGPYITMGMCYAQHPDTGIGNITIHRLCIQSRDELSIFFTPGARHIGAMAQWAEELGRPLPISVSIGVDPAIEIASCFEPPTTPMGYDELSIAGAIREQPVKLCKCISIEGKAVANAEYVIEGEVLPGKRIREDQNSNTGYAMPEFPGYNGRACGDCWVIKVKAVTHRRHPIMQTCIGPGMEHVNMTGICTEASIFDMVERAMPGRLKNVYAHPSGGGKYMVIMQMHKSTASDEGRQRQAALLAFSVFSELKHVILIDEDVDIYDTDDVLWALNTRYQGDRDTVFLPGVRCHPLDPSADPAYSSSISDRGISCKTIYDCTVPYHLKEKFVRAQFMEVNPEKWIKKD